MKKIRRKHKPMAPPPPGQIFMVTFVFFIISTFGSLWIINKGLEPKLLEIAEAKTDQFARNAIFEAVNKKIGDGLNEDIIIIDENDSNGYVRSVQWNMPLINRTHYQTHYRVQQYLERLEEGKAVEPGESLDIDVDQENGSTQQELLEKPQIARIPLGQVTNNVLLNNLGPKIPVHFATIGDVESQVIAKVEYHPINNTMYQLYLRVKVNLRILLPFSTDTTTVETEIPIAQNTVHGDVPEFYNNSEGGTNPSVEIPFGSLPN
ncbi:sporulation protein YunB [Pontibacillus sp. HMF3514]|uniref:sporulation protein YunB n=1 Tax=Pontibacillus sp. HMF3514 TaxID=2692425 RepID=UPI0013204D0E|nr:sporulation protein YunB [Pontibacillus sp. HMF3514]QHE53427.1 sporulation protein YunB [Pontibacillus sp. HMF3514]